ncbi:alpha/beta hydrolase [Actinomadura formosensis]|uniref:alpha/beta hydrolase n=1 Tax=Actinomadura formosensis TaxID=60706 RepID=UPI003D8CEBC5
MSGAGDVIERERPLDPVVKAILMLAGRSPAPPGPGRTGSAGEDGFTPEQARAAFHALTVTARSAGSVAPVGAVEEVRAAGLPARVYRPAAAGPAPTVVFFHGGGFVTGDLDTHDNHCRWLCRETGAVVVSVGYRLAPEAPFPAAVHDCLTAIRWAAGEIAGLGGLPERLAVAGDSAGGNLAAVAAQVCRDEGGPPLCAQLLVYPVVDLSAHPYPSRLEYGEGYLLTADTMRWFVSCYRPDERSPLASPLRGTLTGLPPAVVVTMQYDPLRDEGESYAAALAAAGVPVAAHRFGGLVHGSFELPILGPATVEAMRTAFGSFRKLLIPTSELSREPLS